MEKVVVFDIGGTLMEYKNMPNVWIDYYSSAFEYTSNKLKLNLSKAEIEKAVETLRSFNPRVKYREVDYTPEHIFSAVTKDWKCNFDLSAVISAFFENMKLEPYIYEDTLPALDNLKAQNVKIAALTDVATGMPDELHKSYIPQLLGYFDLYVSSSSCGYRKPNKRGLEIISEHFDVPIRSLFFVGDEEKDIKAAKNCGCTSVLIDRKGRNGKFEQDYTVKNLDEFLTLYLSFTDL